MIESAGFKLAETAVSESSLLKIAKSVENKEMDISKLDKPVVIEKSSFDSLNSDTKSTLRESGMSESLLENARLNKETGIIEIKTLNQNLEGGTHPETGIAYQRMAFNVENHTLEGVFPKFDSCFEVELSKENIKGSDREQFGECNQKLKEAIKTNENLKGNFSSEQLEMIEDGYTPRGFTWHHDIETGKMQLVSTDTHSKTGHTGGKAIWGGGQENR